MVCLRGRLKEEFYDESGELVGSYELSPCSPMIGLNIPIGQWHTVRVFESDTVIIEVEDGAYEPLGEEDIMKA